MTTPTEELAHPEAQRLLRDAPLLRLGYNGTDGTPRVIPIGYFWNGGELVICTATTSPKARALAQRHTSRSRSMRARPRWTPKPS
jgi:nitroimidazol reductase NimA-like FMN-containing flavoprotein (pyridoxamine 5'-phosphate oxidase superfamily)